MPKSVDVAERRGEFVDAAWRVIGKDGLSAATLRRVAKEARCTTGALTHYFANREALLAEALASAHDAARKRMAIAAQGGESTWTRIETLLLEALPLDAARMREWKTRLAFWGEATGSAALRRENARRFAEWGQFLRGALSEFVIEEGTLDRETLLLTALVDGFALRLVLHDDGRRRMAAEVIDAVRSHLEILKERYGRVSAFARADR